MIRKATAGGARHRKPRLRRAIEPLDVELTVRFRFGEDAADVITPIHERSVPMVNSVFTNRDRILRTFVALMFKAGLSSPKVVGHLLPAAARTRRRT